VPQHVPKQAGASTFRNHHALALLPALIQFSINFYISVNTVSAFLQKVSTHFKFHKVFHIPVLF